MSFAGSAIYVFTLVSWDILGYHLNYRLISLNNTGTFSPDATDGFSPHTASGFSPTKSVDLPYALIISNLFDTLPSNSFRHTFFSLTNLLCSGQYKYYTYCTRTSYCTGMSDIEQYGRGALWSKLNKNISHRRQSKQKVRSLISLNN